MGRREARKVKLSSRRTRSKKRLRPWGYTTPGREDLDKAGWGTQRKKKNIREVTSRKAISSGLHHARKRLPGREVQGEIALEALREKEGYTRRKNRTSVDEDDGHLKCRQRTGGERVRRSG